ncbi:hypothetical protein niasHT_030874 [Heterodera trifolii]|uniref:DUF547 domain-containing protein n=1 Tax=Heterodera trifolii TaxID=157864 RepID=A0ABD2I617_9BILA
MLLQLPALMPTFRPSMDRRPEKRDFYEKMARRIRRVGLIRHHQVWTLSHGIKLYKDSFKGDDFVLWIMRSQNLSRPEALETGQCLMEHRLIEQTGWTDGGGRQADGGALSPMSPPINGNNSPANSISRSFSSDRFYRLVDDEDQRAPLNALNSSSNSEEESGATNHQQQQQHTDGNFSLANSRQTSITLPVEGNGGTTAAQLTVGVRDFNARLCAVLERLYALALSEDRRLSLEANFVDIGAATAQERLALFINLHNMMLVHITHKFGLPGTIWQRRKYLYSTYYKIGGHLYSLQSIFNGILRGNRKGIGMLWKPFGDQDPRKEFVIEGGEPLVHFGLNNYTRSTVPVRVYSTENVYEELKANARECLSSKEFLQIDPKTGNIRLAKLFKQYSEDFGLYTEDVLCWIVRLLLDTSEDRMHLAKLLTNSSASLANLSQTVSYLPMDMDLNMSYGVAPPSSPSLRTSTENGDDGNDNGRGLDGVVGGDNDGTKAMAEEQREEEEYKNDSNNNDNEDGRNEENGRRREEIADRANNGKTNNKDNGTNEVPEKSVPMPTDAIETEMPNGQPTMNT